MPKIEANRYKSPDALCRSIDYIRAVHSLRKQYKETHPEKDIRSGGAGDFTFPLDVAAVIFPDLINSVSTNLKTFVNSPNAREQSLQLACAMNLANEYDLKDKFAQILALASRIGDEKPYGDETFTVKLLQGFRRTKEQDFEDMVYGGGFDAKGLFENTITELTEFADGRYRFCLTDYPSKPFYFLLKENIGHQREEDRKSYIDYVVGRRYPQLQLNPEALKNVLQSQGFL